MLALMDLAFVAVNAATNVTLISFKDVDHPELLDEVVYVNTHREHWRSDGDCTYAGLIVPYARDWDVKSGDWPNERVVRKADPETIVGHAIIANKKFCPGEKAPEAVFLAGGYERAANRLRRLESVEAINIAATPAENHPRWLPQVMDRIERLAETDESARDFYAYMLHLDGKASQEVAAPVVDAQVLAIEMDRM